MSKWQRIVTGERTGRKRIPGRAERINTVTMSGNSGVCVPCAHKIPERIDENEDTHFICHVIDL